MKSKHFSLPDKKNNNYGLSHGYMFFLNKLQLIFKKYIKCFFLWRILQCSVGDSSIRTLLNENELYTSNLALFPSRWAWLYMSLSRANHRIRLPFIDRVCKRNRNDSVTQHGLFQKVESRLWKLNQINDQCLFYSFCWKFKTSLSHMARKAVM